MKIPLLLCLLSFLAFTTIAQTSPQLIKDVLIGKKSSLINENSSDKNLEATVVNGKLIYKAASGYIAANDTVNKDFEIFVSDGKAEGTKLLKNINPTNQSYSNGFFTFKNKAFFSAQADRAGQMWVTDGTSEGTKLFKDIVFRRYYNSLNYPSIIELDTNRFIFAGDSNVTMPSGGQFAFTFLFISDGTEKGTYMLKDFNPKKIISGTSNARVGNFAKLNNGKIVFSASTDEFGREVYVTDGTTAGTVLLKDINPGKPDMLLWNDGFTSFHSDGNKVYFFANNNVTGAELWCSDGTVNGTKLLKDINEGKPGALKGSSAWETIDGITYFTANTAIYGKELYQTNGTTEGTVLTMDFAKGIASGLGEEMVQLGKKLLFYGLIDGKTVKLHAYNPVNNKVDSLTTTYVYHLSRNNMYCEKLYFDSYLISKNLVSNPLAVTDGSIKGTGLILNLDNPDYSTAQFQFTEKSIFKVGDNLLYGGDNGKNGIELFKIPLCSSFNTLVNTEESIESLTNSIKISPNPNDGNYAIEFSSNLHQMEYEVLDMTGKIIFQQQLNESISNISQKLPQGIYIIHLKNDKIDTYRKLSITK